MRRARQMCIAMLIAIGLSATAGKADPTPIIIDVVDPTPIIIDVN